ncbi:type II secretion system F family protein [Alcaligenes endophyticus]|uniref:Type II secretion system F family protein n=1 Tax=Alcaligenes endophyticus TaxID=1929088 RepID=A0ABT8EHD9_9BURK|nr:type II secretion system F family protein [Alcaligenes endophyticus]MCX5592052.1 type II secretion system F family protein [Alcaligenes endophyticus]MDN4120699.1 type II secretion system F family protein [Alcaligenes endophyticus]
MYAVLIALVAVLTALVAVLLWWQAERQRERLLSQQVLERQLERRSHPTDNAPRASEVWRSAPKNWQERLLRAGIPLTQKLLLSWCLLCGLPPVVIYLWLGWLPALALGLAMLVASYTYLWFRTDKRQRKAIAQIPEFLDLMVRLITIGQSMGAAFLGAVEQTSAPLGEVLQEAKALHQSGQELDQALRTVARHYGLHELFLVSSVIGVAIRFGGRSDQTMERMAGFMRDRENARHELVAMSAEVRLSAWVLALLPAAIAVYILIFNHHLFMTMWLDPLGFRMLVGALLLQLGGCYWLYRMARNV